MASGLMADSVQTEPSGLSGRGQARRVAGNSVGLMGLQLARLVIAFLLTPFMLNQLGLLQFGLWTFLGSATGMLGILDLGIGTTFVRFIARHHATGDMVSIARLASLGVAIYLVLGVLLSPVALAVGPLVVHHLHLAPPLASEAFRVFLLLFAYLFVANAMAPMSALLAGMGDLRLASLAGLAGQVVYAVLVAVTLLGGAGLYGVVLASFCQVAVVAAICYVIARRRLDRVFANPLRIGRDLLGEVLSFGGWMQINKLSTMVNLETDAVVIGAAVSVSDVGIYQVANRLALLTRMFPLTLLSALLPAASAAYAEADHALLRRLRTEGNRVLTGFSLVVGGAIASLSPAFIDAWLPHRYPHLQIIVLLLVVSYVINNLTGVGTTMVQAAGRPRLEVEYGVVGALLNVGLTVGLVFEFGLYGVLAGTVAGIVLSSLYFLWRYHRTYSLTFRQEFGAWLWRLVLSVSAAAVAARAFITMMPWWSSEPRLDATLLVATGFTLYVIALSVGFRVSGFAASIDPSMFRKVLPAPLAGALQTRLAFAVGIRRLQSD